MIVFLLLVAAFVVGPYCVYRIWKAGEPASVVRRVGYNGARRLHPLGWLAAAPVSFAAFSVTFLIGVFSPGLRVHKTCMQNGQIFDREYRSKNWEEASRFFPLSNRCNADYDLVPPWINPALLIFAAMTLAFLALAIDSFIARHKSRIRITKS
ncbi:MAG: hypothetical protein L0G87_03610 [Renibacterium salmoninarum]|nr:hypothetical protein [Renibacterium salmoninarum]